MFKNDYYECRLCARNCGVDRTKKTGFCKSTDEIYVSYYSLHEWEEPPLSGSSGAGTIFFDGCSLGCVFCQNAKISRGRNGKKLSVNELSEIMLELQRAGAHNVDLVTPTHFSPSVREAVKLAVKNGLKIPIVYNTGGYDNVEALQKLEGIVDVYLPDFKYYTSKTALKYSFAEDYPEAAKKAISEMFRQTGECVIDENGLMKKGVIVRILVLPRHTAEAKLCIKYIYETYRDKVYISIMNQYTPMPGMAPPLNRRVTEEEYGSVVEYAVRLGVKNAFVQEGGTASESFIPVFGEGDSISGITKSK